MNRYYNKYLAVKCIILTTTIPFEEFFAYAKNKSGVHEPVTQFMRRFSVVIKVKSEKDSFGNEFAIGQLYAVEKIQSTDPMKRKRKVGDRMVNYDHELIEMVGKQIRVETPESKTRAVIDDIMKYF